MAAKRGSYKRRYVDPLADEDRVSVWETYEYSTARKVGLGCDYFWKKRELIKPTKPKKQHER